VEGFVISRNSADAGLAPQRIRGSGTLQQPVGNQHYDTDHDHGRRCDEKHKGVGVSAVAMMRKPGKGCGKGSSLQKCVDAKHDESNSNQDRRRCPANRRRAG
jgi:hypothetical protein